MRQIRIPDGWYNWALPSGEYCVLVPYMHVETHLGPVYLELFEDHADNALFLTCSKIGGFKFAGQSHLERGTLEWNGVWKVVGTSFGVNPQIYDLTGTLRMAVGPTSHQGYRFVRPDNSLATGDETYEADPVKQLGEWTEKGDLTVGFHDLTLSVYVDGVRRIITRGNLGANCSHLERDGDSCVVTWHVMAEKATYILWFDRSEVDQFPLELPSPNPEKPRCTITQFPSQIDLGQGASCTAAYGGGEATEARWQYRSVGETIWVTDIVQTPPRTEHIYHFEDAGQYDISLTVIGPGGSDITASLRRITVKDTAMPVPTRLQICFGPNLGTSDFAQLGTETNLWQWGFDRIGAFQFYQGHFSLDGRDYGNRFCGVNTYDWLNSANLFTKLHKAGILIEVQVAGKSLDTIEKIRAKFAALDPPVRLGGVCYDHAFAELSGEDFAAEVKAIREMDSHLAIGAYCAYPMASIENIFDRLEVWDANGGRPDFLRMDVDYNQRSVYTADIHRQIREMLAERDDEPSMTLQVTINAKEHISDAEWVRQAGTWFDYCKALGFDGFAVQSWASTPSEENRQLPHNLSESDSTSHTFLLRACLEKLS